VPLGGGVVRAYNLTDVLQTMSDATGNVAQQLTGSVTGIGIVVEADEPAVSGDTATAGATIPQGWDQGVWAGVGWS
jgi:hypothetical protein